MPHVPSEGEGRHHVALHDAVAPQREDEGPQRGEERAAGHVPIQHLRHTDPVSRSGESRDSDFSEHDRQSIHTIGSVSMNARVIR